jgi:hypothetical protein
MIEFEMTTMQRGLLEALHDLGKSVIRPQSLAWDRAHDVDQDFLRNFYNMSQALKGDANPMQDFQEGPKHRDPSKPVQANRTAALGAEELAWADAAIML